MRIFILSVCFQLIGNVFGIQNFGSNQILTNHQNGISEHGNFIPNRNGFQNRFLGHYNYDPKRNIGQKGIVGQQNVQTLKNGRSLFPYSLQDKWCFIFTCPKPNDQRLECGVEFPNINSKSTRIVNGMDAQEGQFPWVVALVKFDGSHYCTGVSINYDWILTAAHCFDIAPNLLTVIFNKWNSKAQQKIGWANIGKLIVHENYTELRNSVTDSNYYGVLNDIALIKLERPLNHNLNWPALHKFWRPICLPNFSTDLNYNYGTECKVPAFGRIQHSKNSPFPDKLQWMRVSPISYQECQVQAPDLNTPNKMCYRGFEEGQATAEGDSGSPVQCRTANGKWMLEGITGQGIGFVDGPPENITFYTVFTMGERLSSHIDWVMKTISNN